MTGPEAAFELADVRPMIAALICQRLLRDAMRLAQTLQCLRKVGFRKLYWPRFIGATMHSTSITEIQVARTTDYSIRRCAVALVGPPKLLSGHSCNG